MLHGVLLEALRCEAEVTSGTDGTASADADASAVQAMSGLTLGGGQDQAGGGGRRCSGATAAAAAASLAPARRDRVVEAALADAEHQLGLVNACIEVPGC